MSERLQACGASPATATTTPNGTRDFLQKYICNQIRVRPMSCFWTRHLFNDTMAFYQNLEYCTTGLLWNPVWECTFLWLKFQTVGLLSEESQCGFLFGLRNSTLNFFFGSRNSTLAFFGPKESQSKKPFFARFLTVFPTFSTILEKQFYLGGI